MSPFLRVLIFSFFTERESLSKSITHGLITAVGYKESAFVRTFGTRVPKQNCNRRAGFHYWHPGALPKGAPAVKKVRGFST